jgi:hypothetical protein
VANPPCPMAHIGKWRICVYYLHRDGVGIRYGIGRSGIVYRDGVGIRYGIGRCGMWYSTCPG